MFTPHKKSHVTCRMSRVTCHMSHVICLLFLLLFGQSGEAYRWRVCYQRGLPRLVFFLFRIGFKSFFSSICLFNLRHHLFLLYIPLHKFSYYQSWMANCSFHICMYLNLDQFWPHWTHSYPLGPIWTNLDHFRALWRYFELFGPIWRSLKLFRAI